MNAQTDLTQITPGTAVVGVDGQTIGMVEAVRDESLTVAGHTIPAAAIARIEEDRVLLHLAKAAFRARHDPALAG